MYGYKKIATEVNISSDAVRSFLKRNNTNCNIIDKNKCLYCGSDLENILHHKKKKFCSDNYRRKWWSINSALMHHKTIQKCQQCNIEFSADRKRKFCSWECYLKFRFGKAL